MKRKIKILIIGSIPPPIGGTTVLLQQLIYDLLTFAKNTKIQTVNTSKIRGAGIIGVNRFFQAIWSIIVGSIKVDVITLHCATTALPGIGIIVLFIARILKKPLIVRKFGGTDYKELGGIRARLAECVLRNSDLYLAETLTLVRLANRRGIHQAKWYPNNRPNPQINRNDDIITKSCSNYVFIGHLNETKGIKEIIEIDPELPSFVKIDVYGPFTGSMDQKIFENCQSVRYRGIINPNNVIQCISQYHALLAPTYHSGEGYPGVIIEAYAAGIPVITTHWRHIAEIVDNNTGILIPPKDANALLCAINLMSNNMLIYQNLKAGVIKRRLNFDSKKWAAYFEVLCEKVLQNTAKMGT